MFLAGFDVPPNNCDIATTGVRLLHAPVCLCGTPLARPENGVRSCLRDQLSHLVRHRCCYVNAVPDNPLRIRAQTHLMTDALIVPTHKCFALSGGSCFTFLTSSSLRLCLCYTVQHIALHTLQISGDPCYCLQLVASEICRQLLRGRQTSRVLPEGPQGPASV